MHQQSTAQKNITPPITCTAPWRVSKVSSLEDFQFDVEFLDGVKGRVFMKERIFSPRAGIFSTLKNIDLFNQIFVEYGVATWPGEIDLAPDAMHDEIQKNGQWILK